jgi:phospholipid/cholesterol/gamma-HCH transport system substrate-binding protein
VAGGGKDRFVTPLKVGIFVVVSAITFIVFLSFVSTRQLSRRGSYDVFALFTDVLGLQKKSPVQIAGIDIGRIKSVELYQGKAKVTLEIDGNVELFEDASIEKVSISLLGDYKLSVDPGHPDHRKLENGDEIKNVKSLSNVDAIVAEVREMSTAIKKLVAGTPEQPAPLEEIVRDVQRSSAAARVVLEEVAKNIDTNTQKLENILDNVDKFTRDLKDISQGRDQEFDQIVNDAKAIASALRRTSENIDKIVSGQDQDEIKSSVKSLKTTLDSLNRTLANVESITQKIDKGQGTVGKLVNDPTLNDEATEAVQGVNSLVGGLARLQTWVNLRSEFQFRTGAAKNYVQFILQPKEDKYYIIELIDDPRGFTDTVITDVQSTSPEEGRNFQYRQRTTTTTDQLKFSLEFGKRFYFVGFRFGIIESKGGIGMDFHFLDNRLEFYFDANRFGEDSRNPRFKGLALLEIVPHIYVHGGVDDPFNPATVDYFLGLGVRFNDEDLKSLLTIAGSPARASR